MLLLGITFVMCASNTRLADVSQRKVNFYKGSYDDFLREAKKKDFFPPLLSCDSSTSTVFQECGPFEAGQRKEAPKNSAA